jgi:hypothetical protein
MFMINDATLTISISLTEWGEVQQQQVFMINDVNLAALGFYKFPKHQNISSPLLLSQFHHC